MGIKLGKQKGLNDSFEEDKRGWNKKLRTRYETGTDSNLFYAALEAAEVEIIELGNPYELDFNVNQTVTEKKVYFQKLVKKWMEQHDEKAENGKAEYEMTQDYLYLIKGQEKRDRSLNIFQPFRLREENGYGELNPLASKYESTGFRFIISEN